MKNKFSTLSVILILLFSTIAFALPPSGGGPPIIPPPNPDGPDSPPSDIPAEWDSQLSDKNINEDSPGGILFYNLKSRCTDPDSPIIITIDPYSSNYDLTLETSDYNLRVSNLKKDYFGSETISVDCNGVNNYFILNVNPINDPPVVSDIPDQTIDEGSSFLQIPLDNYVYDVDNLNSEIIWSYLGNSELIVNINNRIATITPPDINWNGAEIITFTATDPEGLFDSNSATFTVNSINDIPTAIAGDDRTINAYSIETFDGSASYDIDGTIVSYDWDFGDGNTASGTVVQHAFAHGIYTVTLTVTDNEGATDTDDLNVIANGIPTAVAGGPYYGYVNQPVLFDGSDSTDDGAIVSYDWNFGDSNTGSGETTTHTYLSEGDYTVTLTVIDNHGLPDTDTTTAHISISSGNNPPIITSTPITTAQVNQIYTYDVEADDPDEGDDIIFSLTNAPTGMTIYPNSGQIEWIPTSIGTYNVVVRAEDNHGAYDIQSYNLQVSTQPIEPEVKVTKKHLFSTSSISLPTNTYNQGDMINGFMQLRNIGQLKEKNIAVYASILDLGIETIVTQNLKLGPHDNKWLPLELNLPYNINEGEYLLRIEITNSHHTEIKYIPIFINNRYISNF